MVEGDKQGETTGHGDEKLRRLANCAPNKIGRSIQIRLLFASDRGKLQQRRQVLISGRYPVPVRYLSGFCWSVREGLVGSSQNRKAAEGRAGAQESTLKATGSQ